MADIFVLYPSPENMTFPLGL